MPRTPEDRASSPKRIFRHGPYRGVVWGKTIQVHEAGSPEKPIYSKTMKGDIGEENMDVLAETALPEIAQQHEIKMAKENKVLQDGSD